MKQITWVICLVFYLTGLVSCKKMIATDFPRTQLTAEKVFADDQSATAAVAAIYAQFNGVIAGNIHTVFGLYTDELQTTSANTATIEFANGFVSVNNSTNLNIWRSFYTVIYQCNVVLEHIEESDRVTATTKQQLKGEVLFLRALSHFYLAGIFGDVPKLLTTDVRVTSAAPRKPIEEVLQQSAADLREAKNILPEMYVSTEKVRVNKWAAAALLARVYLHLENWTSAEGESSLVINSGKYSLSPLNAVFLRNSSEAILQFWTQLGFTQTGNFFIPVSHSVPLYPVPIEFVNTIESADQRKAFWLKSILVSGQTYYYPFKYKNRVPVSGSNAEYVMFLRLGEQYLIRAEARVQLNRPGEAQSDLNVIRSRSGLMPDTSTGRTDLLTAINRERRIELLSEWGHRFFDLKRTGRLHEVNQLIKPSWQISGALLPVPQYELLNNPALYQNPGY